MSHIQEVKADLNELYQIVEENLYKCKSDNQEVIEAKYHHNTNYLLGKKIVKHGILSLHEQIKLENRTITEAEKRMLNDENHVNGDRYISISSTDIDYDKVSDDDMIYNPTKTTELDILISDDIQVRRNSSNYANEYLVLGRISPRKFKSIDIRILENIFNDEKYSGYDKLTKIKKFIDCYNAIREIAIIILKKERNILIRELSKEEMNLDLHKLSKLPKLVLENESCK